MTRVLACLLLLWASLAQGQVRIESDRQGVETGNSFTVRVKAQDLSGIYGMDLALSYPAEQVDPVDAAPDRTGAQVQPAPAWGENAFVAANRFEATNGLHTLVLARIAPADPLSGDLLLWEGRFEATRAGKADFTLNRLEFGTREGEKIQPEISTGSASVNIGSGSATTDTSGSEPPVRDINWLHLALAGLGLVIVVLLVVIYRLSRRSG